VFIVFGCFFLYYLGEITDKETQFWRWDSIKGILFNMFGWKFWWILFIICRCTN